MKRATMIDVAKHAGVSTATVSRVLNNEKYVSEDLKKRVLDVIEELNYVSNTLAKNLKTQTSNSIGIIVPDLSNKYYMDIIKGVEDRLSNKGFVFYLASSNGDSERENEILRNMFENRVKAIILATSGSNEDAISDLLKMNQLIVLVDRKLDEDLNISHIVENNYAGSFDMTDAVLKKGYRNVAIIAGLLHTSVGQERYQGCMDAFEAHGMKPVDVFDGDYTQISGENAINTFAQLSTQPEVIISMNNAMTLGALRARHQRKAEDFYRNILIASYGEFELQELFFDNLVGYVSQNPYEMGESVADVLEYNFDVDQKNIVHKSLLSEFKYKER